MTAAIGFNLQATGTNNRVAVEQNNSIALCCFESATSRSRIAAVLRFLIKQIQGG